jgi:hypothetical protein
VFLSLCLCLLLPLVVRFFFRKSILFLGFAHV